MPTSLFLPQRPTHPSELSLTPFPASFSYLPLKCRWAPESASVWGSCRPPGEYPQSAVLPLPTFLGKTNASFSWILFPLCFNKILSNAQGQPSYPPFPSGSNQECTVAPRSPLSLPLYASIHPSYPGMAPHPPQIVILLVSSSGELSMWQHNCRLAAPPPSPTKLSGC